MKTPIKVLFLVLVAATLQSCSLLSAAGISSQGQPTKEVKDLSATTEASVITVDHSLWDQLLKMYVNEKGDVDYKGLLENDREALDSYLELLASYEPNDDWSVKELLAYYINTYNAYTVDLILDNYPVASIKDISGPWTKGIVPIGNTKLSLGGIENGILRKMNEPRIHFAINCASASCPKILNEAFVASKINEQLDRATREFIESDKNEISASNPKLSNIFNWYAKDFEVNGSKDVIGYINKYSTLKINATAPLEYKEYDWSLNEQK